MKSEPAAVLTGLDVEGEEITEDVGAVPNVAPRKRICSRSTWSLLGKSIGQGLKKNIIPGIVLLVVEAAIVICYYKCPPCSPVYAWITRFKDRWGILYSALATMVFGAVLPFFIGLFTGEIPHKPFLALATLGLLLVQWAGIGAITDRLYWVQGQLWGTDFSFKTVAIKVVCDQFIYTPCCGVWVVFWPFHWRNSGFSFSRCCSSLSLYFLWTTIAPMLITIWSIWIPSNSVIYSLPPALQVPAFTVVLCFANLILLFVSRTGSNTQVEHQGVATKSTEEMTA